MSRRSGISVPMVLWFALALLVFYLVLLGGGWGGIYVVQLRVASLVLIAGVLVAWGLAAAARPAWRPRSAIWPALAVALAALAMSTALSRNPRISIEYLAWSVILVALYLLCQRLLADPFFRSRLMGLAAILCATVGALYVLACVGAWATWWGLVGHIAIPPLRPGFASLTFGNPSAVMTISVLLLASAVGHLGFASRARRASVLGLTALTLAVVVLSGSRAGWLGLGFAIVATMLAWLLVAENRAIIRGLLRTRVAKSALLGIAAVGVVMGVALAPAIISRARSGGEEIRATFFAVALQMGLEAPAVGSGPGTWAARRIALTPATETDLYIPHAHDVYLQTFAEGGVLGLAAGAVAVGCVLWLIARSVRSGDAARVRFGWCALFATLYFGGHQVLDFYPNMPAALFAFALPIIWLDAASDRPIISLDVPRGWRWICGGSAVAAIVVAVGVLAWSEASALRLAEAVDAANGGDWSAAVGPAQAAVEQDPGMPANQFTLGLAASHAGDLAAAEGALSTAAATDDLPVAWLDLAAVQVGLGKDEAARGSLRRALRLGVQQPAVALAAGDVYMRLGDTAAAREAYVAAISGAPSLAGDPYWAGNAAVAAAWPTILVTALDRMPPETGFDAALSAGDVDRAREAASTIGTADARTLALVVIDAWTGSDTAYAELVARVSEHPFDLAALAWAARIASHRGDEAAAQRFQAWSDIVVSGSGLAGHDLRTVTHAPGRPAAGGLSGLYYGHYTYRRPTPWDQLVPSLPHLVYR